MLTCVNLRRRVVNVILWHKKRHITEWGRRSHIFFRRLALLCSSMAVVALSYCKPSLHPLRFHPHCVSFLRRIFWFWFRFQINSIFPLSLSAGEFVEERKCPEEVKRSIHSYCYVLEVRQISASTRVRYFTCQLPFNRIRHHPGLFVCFFFFFLNLKASLLPWYEMMIFVKHGNSDFISEF